VLRQELWYRRMSTSDQARRCSGPPPAPLITGTMAKHPIPALEVSCLAPCCGLRSSVLTC